MHFGLFFHLRMDPPIHSHHNAGLTFETIDLMISGLLVHSYIPSNV